MNKILKETECWVFYSADGTDKFFKKFFGGEVGRKLPESFVVLSKDKTFLITSTLDIDNVKGFNGTTLSYNSSAEIDMHLVKIFTELKFPKEIYLNYSSISALDSLGYGGFIKLQKRIKEAYKSNKFKIKSGENLILSAGENNTEEDIENMRKVTVRTQEIMGQVFVAMKVGISEKEIEQLAISFLGEGEEASFEPIILIGENLTKGGHANPSDKKLQKGETVYIDFGIRVIAENGKTYCSDLQRMGYALKDGETKAESGVQKVFDTLIKAIDLGRRAMKPSKKGHQIDEIVRGYVLKSGYPSYNHGTGHPVGSLVHELGTTLAGKNKLRFTTMRKLALNGIYTVEPRIAIKNGGSIEEMVLVTEKGGEFLGSPQKKLYLIK